MRALVLLWTLGSLLEETRPWGFRNGIFHNSIWLGEDTGTPAVGGGREGGRLSGGLSDAAVSVRLSRPEVRFTGRRRRV